jgi:signal transduction histidine kinase
LARHKFGNFWNAVKATLSKLSELYLAALRIHLKPGSKADMQPAVGLGRQAVAFGLETLDLARIHEQALKTWITLGHSSRPRERMVQRARFFFAEAIAPIEKTHRAALAADGQVSQLNQTLRRRTEESSASARHLKRGIVQRQATEEALKKSGKHCATLLEKSSRLQKHLRHLTHEILSAQEDERQKISRQLHDEIAQTLLGINVRLLTLKKAAKGNAEILQEEIDTTQRLVQQSVRTIHRFAHECGLHYET